MDAQDQAEDNTGSDLDHRTLGELSLAATDGDPTGMHGSATNISKAKQKANELGLGLRVEQEGHPNGAGQ